MPPHAIHPKYAGGRVSMRVEMGLGVEKTRFNCAAAAWASATAELVSNCAAKMACDSVFRYSDTRSELRRIGSTRTIATALSPSGICHVFRPLYVSCSIMQEIWCTLWHVTAYLWTGTHTSVTPPTSIAPSRTATAHIRSCSRIPWLRHTAFAGSRNGSILMK